MMGKRPKLFWWQKLLTFLLSLSLLFSQFLSFSVKPVFAVQTYDMASPSSYNLRFDGAEVGDNLGKLSYGAADIDNNGKPDLFVEAWLADNNSRLNSGSLYIIFDSLLDDFSGTSQTIDIANSNNYSLRIDGPSATSLLGGNPNVDAQDMDGDGKKDLLIGTYGSGAVYILCNTLIASLRDAGQKNIDLANSANYSLKLTSSDSTFGYTLTAADVNNNGRNDLLVYARTNNNSRTRSGSVYLIYDSLLSSYSSQDVNISNSTNYNLRFDGALAYDYFGANQILVADLNNNNNADLLIGAYGGSDEDGSLYVIYDSIISGYTSQNIDVAQEANYSLRLDGAASGDSFSKIDCIRVVDIDSNGRQDLLVGAIDTDNNSRTDSGSLYVIYDSLIEGFTEKTISVATNTNWSLRFDSARANDLLTDYSLAVWDFDNDGKKDILTGGFRHDTASKTDAGGVYVIYNNVFKDYSGPGKTFDLLNSANYSVLFEGAAADERVSRPQLADFNNDGQVDLFFGSYLTDNNSRTNSGSLYIIYNYPHSWDLDSISDYFPGAPSYITGRISATGSTTNIYNVQYSIDGSAFYGTWTECPNDGGSYDSTDTEKFKCPITATLAEGLHKFYLRSSDVNGSYTARLKTIDLRIDKTSPTVTLTQVGSSPFKEGINLTNLTPTFFGKITDSLSNSLAAGPDYLETELKKKDFSDGWQTIESKRINLTENYWTANNSKITDNTLSTSSKYSVFSYTPATKLSAGSYQLSVIGVDKADNHSPSTSFQFILGANQSQTISSPPISEPQTNQPETEATLTSTPIPQPTLKSALGTQIKTVIKFFPNVIKLGILFSFLAFLILAMIKKLK